MAKKSTSFSQALKQGAGNKANMQQSLKWFRDMLKTNATKAKAGSLGRGNPSSYASRNSAQATSPKSISTGSMYLMAYPDPKHKETLPYFDMWPLVMPFSSTSKLMTGINLHYLPPSLRAVLFDELIKFRDTGKFIKPDTNLTLSWNIIKQMSQYNLVKPTVHSYLYPRIKMAIQIPADEWHKIIFLPFSRFAYASRQKVYNDSRKKAGR